MLEIPSDRLAMTSDIFAMPTDKLVSVADKLEKSSDTFAFTSDNPVICSDNLVLPTDTLALPTDTFAMPSDRLAMPSDSFVLSCETSAEPLDSLITQIEHQAKQTLKALHMTATSAIAWFSSQFGSEIAKRTAETPFSAALLCAIAYQETGSIWARLIGKLSPQEIAALCAGDTLNWPKRRVFPRHKADLLTHPRGKELFSMARKALVEMAARVPSYSSTAKRPDKFCHGFGIFQLDIQHAKTHPDFFLNLHWKEFSRSLQYCLQELIHAQTRMGWASKTTLTKREQIFVAIAYNKGKANPNADFKQGYKDATGRYYGENVAAYFEIADKLQVPLKQYRVKPTVKALNLRKTPSIPKAKPKSNILTQLPGGQALKIIDHAPNTNWFKVEVSINSAVYIGFVSAGYVEEHEGGKG